MLGFTVKSEPTSNSSALWGLAAERVAREALLRVARHRQADSEAEEGTSSISNFGIADYNRRFQNCSIEIEKSYLLTRALRRSRKHPFSIRQLDCPGITSIGSILRPRTLNGDLVALFQRILLPALPRQHVRTSHLALPFSDSTFLVLSLEVNPDMRIRPFHFRHGSRQVNRFAGIKLRRKRMVSDQS